MPFYIVPLTVK